MVMAREGAQILTMPKVQYKLVKNASGTANLSGDRVCPIIRQRAGRVNHQPQRIKSPADLLAACREAIRVTALDGPGRIEFRRNPSRMVTESPVVLAANPLRLTEIPSMLTDRPDWLTDHP